MVVQQIVQQFMCQDWQAVFHKNRADNCAGLTKKSGDFGGIFLFSATSFGPYSKMNRLDAHIFFPAQDILSARTTKAGGYFLQKIQKKLGTGPFYSFLNML
ncbi:hypothetical protein [Dysosmobacter sp.]|uniref:hypothetical protein n=1 Tax=Dysosmobacter sp. TaxID=2591382 RepID=UPI002A7F6DCF|nr:hypothetical protein [Dysosmobacter sp.]